MQTTDPEVEASLVSFTVNPQLSLTYESFEIDMGVIMTLIIVFFGVSV